MRPLTITAQLGKVAVWYPTVPIVFAETRRLAEDWTYRFFGAAVDHHDADIGVAQHLDALATAGPVPVAEPTTAAICPRAIAAGLDVADRGRLRPEIRAAHRRHHHGGPR